MLIHIYIITIELKTFIYVSFLTKHVCMKIGYWLGLFAPQCIYWTQELETREEMWYYHLKNKLQKYYEGNIYWYENMFGQRFIELFVTYKR